MKTKINTLFSEFYSIINLFSNDKLTNMHELEKESVDRAKIKLYPTFHEKAPIVQAIDNLEQLSDAIIKMSERVHQKMLASPRGKGILSKVAKYNIPYDPNKVDWIGLMSQIEEYEALLSRAKEYHIKVDTKFYDPVAVERSIEECIYEERRAARDLHSYYSGTRI